MSYCIFRIPQTEASTEQEVFNTTIKGHDEVDHIDEDTPGETEGTSKV